MRVLKKMYYSCFGSKFCIDREYGKEYRKYNVPEKLEKEWSEDIKLSLLYQINNSYGQEQHELVTNLCCSLSDEESVSILMEMLNKDQDSFSKLLYCEQLKDLMHKISNNELCEIISRIIANQKKLILMEISNIDERYKTLYYMKDYDFSENALLARARRL